MQAANTGAGVAQRKQVDIGGNRAGTTNNTRNTHAPPQVRGGQTQQKAAVAPAGDGRTPAKKRQLAADCKTRSPGIKRAKRMAGDENAVPGNAKKSATPPRMHVCGDFARADIPSENRVDGKLCDVYQRLAIGDLRTKMLPVDTFAPYLMRPRKFVTARAKIIQILLELGHQFRVEQQTLHMTSQIADRFLISKNVDDGKDLIFCFAASMMIAIKFNETRRSHPSAKEFLEYAKASVDQRSMCSLERKILRELEFALINPTVMTFVNHYLQGLGVSQNSKLGHVACLYADFTLLDVNALQQSQEKLAAASLLAALEHIVPKENYDAPSYWRAEMEPVIGLEHAEISQISSYMRQKVQHWSKSVLGRKYARKECLGVSACVWPGSQVRALTNPPTAKTVIPHTGPTPAVSFHRGKCVRK